MIKAHKSICFTAVICVSLLGCQAIAYGQNVDLPREPSTRESRIPQTPSATRRVLINIARAVIEVLCTEYGECPSTSNSRAETTTPGTREDRRYLNPDFTGNNSRSKAQQRSFSFNTPAGWQIFEDQSSVTVAPPNEYINGNLTNGVILGLFDLNNASFETGTETYVRQLISNNKYLRRVGSIESNIVDNVPCITNRMEGLSPKSQYVEEVVVYTCRRSTQKLFYVVTVNSGPNAKWYEEENGRMTHSISFR